MRSTRSGAYVVRVNEEGKIAEHWGIVDTMGAMAQLGLLPPPRAADG